jgi:hypothetical protein
MEQMGIKQALGYNAAIYCRLSKDDEQSGDSASIQTQKMMLEKYCIEQGFPIYDVYVDDGYSGLNFNRSTIRTTWWWHTMVDICFGIRGIMMKKLDSFINLLVNVIEFAEKEKEKICNHEDSEWNYDQIQKVVLPEINELLSYANQGKLFFKYGKKQRQLEST